VSSSVKHAGSLMLDRLGYTLLMPQFADLGMARRHGPRTQKRVALTFDDGPTPGSTETVQDTLRAFRVLGTFFCVGANVMQLPELVLKSFDEVRTL
jgi:peptidoglycan-N-acetylglucosamine deacetylase